MILTNYQVDYWICMLDPSYISQISITNPHRNCVRAAIANLNIFKPFSFWESGAAGWSGLENILWEEASTVKTKVLLWAKALSCDLPEWAGRHLVKSTRLGQPLETNAFISQPSVIKYVERLPWALHCPRLWGPFKGNVSDSISKGELSLDGPRFQLHLLRSLVRELCQWILNPLLESTVEAHP